VTVAPHRWTTPASRGAALALLASTLFIVDQRNFAVVYTLPITIFASSAQLVVTWMIHVTGTPMAIAWFLIALWIPGTIAALAMPETRHTRH
jgi:protein-S-isoprenylcysteine O-methyltransferase Ste14